MDINEMIPSGLFTNVSFRYMESYFPKHLQKLAEEGKLYEGLERLENRLSERWDDLIERTMEREGVDEELKARNQLGWVGRVNEIRSRARAAIIDEVLPYSPELEYASEEEDYNEDDWKEHLEGILALMEPDVEEG